MFYGHKEQTYSVKEENKEQLKTINVRKMQKVGIFVNYKRSLI